MWVGNQNNKKNELKQFSYSYQTSIVCPLVCLSSINWWQFIKKSKKQKTFTLGSVLYSHIISVYAHVAPSKYLLKYHMKGCQNKEFKK